jgi:hypothetical protein
MNPAGFGHDLTLTPAFRGGSQGLFRVKMAEKSVILPQSDDVIELQSGKIPVRYMLCA